LQKYSPPPLHFSYFVALQPGIKIVFWEFGDFGGFVSFDLHNILTLNMQNIFYCETNKKQDKKSENFSVHNYSPPSQCQYCRATFGSNYSCKSLGVCIYKLGTSSHWDFCPIFEAKLLQLLQDGWVLLVYSNL
jgi:hypothetical protein